MKRTPLPQRFWAKVNKHDGTLAEVAAQAQEQPGTPIVVPSTARVPRPRNSVVYGIQL